MANDHSVTEAPMRTVLDQKGLGLVPVFCEFLPSFCISAS